MSYDKKLEDMMIGQYTGYSDSIWGRQGAQFYKPPGGSGPTRKSQEIKAVVPIIIHQPSPEQIKAQQRNARAQKIRDEWRSQLNMPIPFVSKITGLVRSYITESGFPEIDESGALVAGEVVTKREHHARLHKLYTLYWRMNLRKAERGDEPQSVAQDAMHRLRLAEIGRYIVPTDAKGEDYRLRLWKEKSLLLWKWTVQQRPRQVRIVEYDRRLRLFLNKSFANYYTNMTYFGIPVSDLKPLGQICFFLNSPLVHQVD